VNFNVGDRVHFEPLTGDLLKEFWGHVGTIMGLAHSRDCYMVRWDEPVLVSNNLQDTTSINKCYLVPCVDWTPETIEHWLNKP